MARVPHDRYRVPLAAFVASPSGDSIDRDLLALAGFGLLLVALGGAVVLFAARRQLALAVSRVHSRSCWRSCRHAAAAVACGCAQLRLSATTVLAWHQPDCERLAHERRHGDSRTVVDDGQLHGRRSGTHARPAEPDHGGGDVHAVRVSPHCRVRRRRRRAARRHPVERSTTTAPQVSRRDALVARRRTRAAGSTTRLRWRSRAPTPPRASRPAASPSYGGGDGASAVALRHVHRCRRQLERAASVGFKYDATAPAVTASPDRKPDGKGWYRKPLTVSFAGTDATSGIAACTAPTRYAGPDLAKAAVVGACRDAAGNSGRGGPGLPVRRDRAEASDGEGRGREGRREDRLEALAGRRARRARAHPGRERQEEDHRLPRQRRELHRQDGPRRRPLPLRDQGERRGGEHGARRPSRRTSTCRRSTGRRPARRSTHRSSSPGRPSRERPSTTSSSTGTR